MFKKSCIFPTHNAKPILEVSEHTPLSAATGAQTLTKEKFEQLYDRLAHPLLLYVNSRINDRAISEEIMQEIFTALWARRKDVTLSSPDSYLYASAKFQILKHIRSKKVRQKYEEHFSLYLAQQGDVSLLELLDEADLKQTVMDCLRPLPEKCQLVFRQSRFEYKSIAEIAAELNLSTRTVENYISQAIQHLRRELQHYPLMLLILYAYFR